MIDKFLFNPFNIQDAPIEQLQEEYIKIYSKVDEGTDNPFIIAANIEMYANLYLIIGEMIARYQKEVDDQKTDVEAARTLQVYKSRDIWIKANEGKPPAMSYFEAQAYEFVKDDILKLNKAKENLRRFKNAWDSTDQKINALKKKYEAKKYEIGFK